MTNYVIDWEKYETAFEDEKVVLMLKKLTREAFLLIIPDLEKVNEAKENKSNHTKSFKAGLEMQGTSKKILEHHMIWKEGFTINGKMPTVEDLCEYSMFSTLIIDIMGELIRMSTMSGAEIKN